MGTAASTLIQDVQFRLVRDDVTTTHIIRRINWAIQDIGNRFFVPELEVKASVTDSGRSGKILLSSTTKQLRWILSVQHCVTSGVAGAVASVNNLIQAGPTMAAGFSNSSITGTPVYWYHFGNYLYVYPKHTTDTVYKICYRMYPNSLTVGSNTTRNSLPSYLDDAIVSGACYMILRDLNENENAAKAYAQYAENLRSLKPYQAEEFAVSRQTVQVQK